MNNAVVTLTIQTSPKNARWMAAGLPSKREYARRIGAEFVNITEARLGGSVASEKYQIGGLLERFDRVFYLDADTVIDPSAPNIFDEVPADCFAAFDESTYLAEDGTRRPRQALLDWLRAGWPDDPCEWYINNGVFVCSREHRWLLDHASLNTALPTYEQTHMSRRIWEALREDHIKVRWLDKCWNFMPRTWVGGDAPGWVPEPRPDPCWVTHLPCHDPLTRAAVMEELNKGFGV